MFKIMIHALNWLLRCFGITKWSRNWSKLAGNPLESRWTATRRLAACAKQLAAWKLSQTREQAASRLPPSLGHGLESFFASSSSFVIFLHLFFLSSKPWATLFHFQSIFVHFSIIFMPKIIIQTNIHAFHSH